MITMKKSIHKWNTFDNFEVVVCKFENRDKDYVNIIKKADLLKNLVNPHGPDGILRSSSDIEAMCFTGMLAEHAVLTYLNSIFEKSGLDLEARETTYDHEVENDQIDIVIFHKEVSILTIEIRSSFSYSSNTEKVYNEWFSLVGFYTTSHKPIEALKDIYITVIFRFDRSKMYMKLHNREEIELHIAAGATKERLLEEGINYNLENKGAFYRVIRPIIKANSIDEIAQIIIDCAKNK